VRGLAVAIVMVVVVPGVPVRTWAQAGWYLTPGLRLSESFDDNIFASSSGRESDFITRISPGLEAGYRSVPFTLIATGGFESDLFAKNPQLDDATSAWRVGLYGHYVPIQPLTLGLNVSYTETKSLPTLTQGLASLALLNPLNPANAVQSGRQTATLLSASSSVAYQFVPRTAATSAFSYTYSTFEGGATNTVYSAQLGLSHQFTALDTGTLNYTVGVFDSPGTSTQVTNTPMIGWIRQFTPQTTLTLSAGPSFVDGSVSPAVNAQLAHQFRLFDRSARASLGYTYSQGFVIGEAGLRNTQTGSGSISVDWTRSLKLTLEAAASRFEGGASPTITSYGITVTATYQILKWLSARANYTFAYQEQSGGNIPHNVVSVGLEVAYPVRADQ
jgi:hypothetical protein